MNKIHSIKNGTPWNGIDSLAQTFDPRDGAPPMLECMVPFYEQYIPLCCEGDPDKLKAALEALEQRNTFAVEDVINPRKGESRMDWTRRCQAEAEDAMDDLILRELGYDVGD